MLIFWAGLPRHAKSLLPRCPAEGPPDPALLAELRWFGAVEGIGIRTTGDTATHRLPQRRRGQARRERSPKHPRQPRPSTRGHNRGFPKSYAKRIMKAAQCLAAAGAQRKDSEFGCAIQLPYSVHWQQRFATALTVRFGEDSAMTPAGSRWLLGLPRRLESRLATPSCFRPRSGRSAAQQSVDD